MRGYIFGAKSIAISTYRAVQALHGDFYIEGFLVTSLENNPHEIDGLPVKEVKTAAQRMTEQDKRRVRVWIAVPDDVQSQAKELLRRYGFMDFVPVDACMESRLLEQYYGQRGIFSSIHELQSGEEMPGISVYAAKFCRDKKLSVPPVFPDYVRSILLGCSGNPSKSLWGTFVKGDLSSEEDIESVFQQHVWAQDCTAQFLHSRRRNRDSDVW